VYASLIDYAAAGDDEERLLDAMLMVAFCHRMLGQLDEARDAYTVLREAAAERKSEQYLLLSELGFAKLASERGNLPAAAGMLDRILQDTNAGGYSTVRARALSDRARVASQLGDHTTAAVLSHEALECTTDPLDRDRILINIGMTLTHMGLWNEARDAYLIASASAQEATVRQLAQINLMELAYLERNEILFEHHLRSASSSELLPYVETVFHETRAHGLRAFGRVEEAASSFRRMLDVAERHGLHEYVMKAEQALKDVARVTPPLASTSRSDVSEQPREIVRVAESLVRLREHAGL
jgi:tetratricopeptide (TPR) repeat protein